MNRRSFIGTSALAFTGLHRLLAAEGTALAPPISPYGQLIPDPKGLLDLPEGFSYSVLSRTGDVMSDGLNTPGQPDGMAAFTQADGSVVLVRNHEMTAVMIDRSPFPAPHHFPDSLDPSLSFSPGSKDELPQIGGTTTLHYDAEKRSLHSHFLSLVGTDRNCAGGKMPWGSWITCEESEHLTEGRTQHHGWCFEVKADPKSGLQKAVPLKALGRFRHEAVALDTDTGLLYLTEDRGDGLLYRFTPDTPGDLSAGKLQALRITTPDTADMRNFHPETPQFPVGKSVSIDWIDLDQTDSPADDLRHRGHRDGATFFARGEGIIYTDGALYICCTSGGNAKQGQILKLTPSENSLELYIQPEESDLLTNGDNICEGPASHLIICEDLVEEHIAKTPHIRGITPEGEVYTIARNALNRSEFAGACWDSPSSTLFVNIQNPGITFAIHGPWA